MNPREPRRGKALPEGITGAHRSAFSIGKTTVLVGLRKTAISFYSVTLREHFSKAQGLIADGKTSQLHIHTAKSTSVTQNVLS